MNEWIEGILCVVTLFIGIWLIVELTEKGEQEKNEDENK